MDQTLHTPEVYDFRQYDHVWQRVTPRMEPYPTLRPDTPASPVPVDRPAQTVPGMSGGQGAAGLPPAQAESQLPGADQNPCCMGSDAAEMLNVIVGFAEEALEEQRQLQTLGRQAPSWARQRLRELAAENGAHAKRLMAVYYLITGSCYRPAIATGMICPQRWCAALRERYHAAACSGFNYARASEGTTDPCLSKLLEELSEDAYSQAGALLEMLERSLRT